MLYIIYADIESLVKKIDSHKKITKKSSTKKMKKKQKHIPCGYSKSSISAFDHIKNKHSLYNRKDCIKRFCESLR